MVVNYDSKKFYKQALGFCVCFVFLSNLLSLALKKFSEPCNRTIRELTMGKLRPRFEQNLFEKDEDISDIQ